MALETKQVIVIRRDLGMRRGKEIAQGAHASMAFLSEAYMQNKTLPIPARKWLEGSFAKVVVRVDTEEELLAIYELAKNEGIIAKLITDSGRTEFNGVPTNTAVAIGPDWVYRIDKITGDLELY